MKAGPIRSISRAGCMSARPSSAQHAVRAKLERATDESTSMWRLLRSTRSWLALHLSLVPSAGSIAAASPSWAAASRIRSTWLSRRSPYSAKVPPSASRAVVSACTASMAAWMYPPARRSRTPWARASLNSASSSSSAVMDSDIGPPSVRPGHGARRIYASLISLSENWRMAALKARWSLAPRHRDPSPADQAVPPPRADVDLPGRRPGVHHGVDVGRRRGVLAEQHHLALPHRTPGPTSVVSRHRYSS